MESWHRAMKIARDVLTGEVVPTAKMRDALYYLNPKYSNPGSVAWFNANLRQIGSSGSHLFYTDKK
jgi:spore germination cell wall hydrolase CwlJ-like protein